MAVREKFEPVSPEEVDRVLEAVSSATCILDPCPSWLVKASRVAARGWVQALVNAASWEGAVPPAQEAPLDPTVLDNFCPAPSLPVREGYREGGELPATEGLGRGGLSGPLSIGTQAGL